MTNPTEINDELTQLELVEAIRAATQEVFSTMLGVEATVGDVFVEKEEAVPTSGVVSMIGLAGAWVGTGSLSCPAHSPEDGVAFSARRILSRNRRRTGHGSGGDQHGGGQCKDHLENRLGACGSARPP